MKKTSKERELLKEKSKEFAELKNQIADDKHELSMLTSRIGIIRVNVQLGQNSIDELNELIKQQTSLKQMLAEREQLLEDINEAIQILKEKIKVISDSELEHDMKAIAKQLEEARKEIESKVKGLDVLLYDYYHDMMLFKRIGGSNTINQFLHPETNAMRSLAALLRLIAAPLDGKNTAAYNNIISILEDLDKSKVLINFYEKHWI